MGTADLHIHTSMGDGMADIPELLTYVEERTALSVIAITEHDGLQAAFAARDAWAQGRYRFELIAGEEVTTIEGHLLALFIEEPVVSLKPLMPTLEAIHLQGGIAIIPHPMSWLTRSLGRRTIDRIARERRERAYFDAIELSGSPAARAGAKLARRLNQEHYHFPEVGGSDAHFLESIGASHTEFDGSTARELRQAIEAGTTAAVVGKQPSLRQIGLRRIAQQQYRGMLATPRQMGWLPTIGSFLRRAWP